MPNFYRRELDPDRRRCTPGLRFYQTLMDTDRELRFANQERLRDLKRTHGGEVAVFCSHDARELSALQSGGLAGLRSLTRNLAADAAPAAAPA